MAIAPTVKLALLLFKIPFGGELKFLLIANFEEFKKSYFALRGRNLINEVDLEKIRLNNIPSYITLPFGFGRSYGYDEIRKGLLLPKLPDHFYIQQLTQKKLNKIMELEGITNPYKLRK